MTDSQIEYDPDVTANTTNYMFTGEMIMLPKHAGGYQLGGEFGLRIMFRKKPNWFHRTMMALCLGWEWIDTSN